MSQDIPHGLSVYAKPTSYTLKGQIPCILNYFPHKKSWDKADIVLIKEQANIFEQTECLASEVSWGHGDIEIAMKDGKSWHRCSTEGNFPNLHSKLFLTALLLSQSIDLHFRNSKQNTFRTTTNIFLFLPISPLLLMFLLQLPDTQQILSCHTLWIRRRDKQLAESKRGFGVSSSSCWVTSVCSVAEVLFWAQRHRWKLIRQCGEERWGEEAIGVSREQGRLIGVCDYTGCC